MFVYWNRPGVRDQSYVESLSDVRRQFDVELAEEIAQDLARRGCVRHDQIDLAEARVVVMVVDVDGKWNAPEYLRVRDPALVRAVHGKQNPLGDVVRPAALQARHRHEPILRRQRRVAMEHHDGVLAQLLESEIRREQRA